MSFDRCAALPHGVMGLSAVCDCGISGSYSLTILVNFVCIVFEQGDKMLTLSSMETLIDIFTHKVNC